MAQLITDDLWETLKPYIPRPKPRRQRCPGRKPLDARRVLTGIVFVLRSGIPWNMLPKEMGCGSGCSCRRYLAKWQEEGVWDRLHKMLLDKLRKADKLDWSRAVVDSGSVRAVFGGRKQGRIRRIDGNWAPNTTLLPTGEASPLR